MIVLFHLIKHLQNSWIKLFHLMLIYIVAYLIVQLLFSILLVVVYLLYADKTHY
jgi:hypothetical protein